MKRALNARREQRKPIHRTIFMSSLWDAIKHNIYSIWLFTYSDLKTIVGPKTAFGVFSALRASTFGMSSRPTSLILTRIPLVAFWAWINLLPFAMDNQRQPAAIKEDAMNKPWRPLPSQRLSSLQARSWMLKLYPVVILSSLYLGGIRQCLSLTLLGFWYNDTGGADKNPIVRNLINACGFLCYTSGAMEVAYGAWIVVYRTLAMRSISDDKRTFWVWNLLLVMVYALSLRISGKKIVRPS